MGYEPTKKSVEVLKKKISYIYDVYSFVLMYNTVDTKTHVVAINKVQLCLTSYV